MTSLRNDAVERLGAELIGVVMGLSAGVITARLLGPAGRGQYAVLAVLTSLMAALATLGLGDSLVYLVRNCGHALAPALASVLRPTMAASALATGALWLVSASQFGSLHGDVGAAVAVACIGVPVTALANVTTGALNAQGRVRATSRVLAATTVATTTALIVLMGPLGLHLTGAMAAGSVAAVGALVVNIWLLHRAGVPVRVGGAPETRRAALRYGVPVQSAQLLMFAAARIDVVVVHGLAGAGPAGLYAVALTLGTLPTYIPVAITYAAFPRMALLPANEARELLGRLARACLLSATGAAAIFALLAPTLVPLVFGTQFQTAAWPAVALLAGGILGAMQWVIARMMAARGETRVLVLGYAGAVTTMLLVDVFTVPLAGAMGAAVGSVCGNVSGLAVTLALSARSESGIGSRELIPRRADAAGLAVVVASAVAKAASGTRRRMQWTSRDSVG